MLLYVVITKNQATVWRLPAAGKASVKISLGFYLRAALPGAFSLWAEWWAACILGVLAGLLPGGDASVAANGILFACLSVFYMTFVGVQMATQQRMGELRAVEQEIDSEQRRQKRRAQKDRRQESRHALLNAMDEEARGAFIEAERL